MNNEPYENDYEEQYKLLEEEDKQDRKRKLVYLFLVVLLIMLLATFGSTFSYFRRFHHDSGKDKDPKITCSLNCDLNNDGKCDLNCDTNGDGVADLNIDTDGDFVPDKAVDTNGDGICDYLCPNYDTKVKPNPSDKEYEDIIDIDTKDKVNIYITKIQSVYAENIIPGWKDTARFKVTNNSDYDAYFNIDWTNVNNTITEKNNIVYKVFKNNGTLVKDETPAPYKDERLFTKVLIKAHTTDEYQMDFEFKETGVDQSEDANKVFNGVIKGSIVVD